MSIIRSPQSGEKLGYTLTVLLSFTVLLTVVSDTLPRVSTSVSALRTCLTSPLSDFLLFHNF